MINIIDLDYSMIYLCWVPYKGSCYWRI